MLDMKLCYKVALIAFGALIASTSNAKELDVAVPGANYPAWSSMSECQAQRSGEGCHLFHPDACGWEIYTTKRIADSLKWAYQDGYSADIHTMSNGRFDQYICVLWPK